MLSTCLLGLASAIAVAAQTPAFEAASIKPSAAQGHPSRTRGGPGTANLGQIV
jgi:uncharacterized protein (TIGR03435 family)